jgi:hypothetical protein
MKLYNLNIYNIKIKKLWNILIEIIDIQQFYNLIDFRFCRKL